MDTKNLAVWRYLVKVHLLYMVNSATIQSPLANPAMLPCPQRTA